jgi:hypothetical protein
VGHVRLGVLSKSRKWQQVVEQLRLGADVTAVAASAADAAGRANGYCDEVLNLCPDIQVFIISDKKKGFQSQDTVDWYRPCARGFDYNGNRRHILTTRRDGTMEFSIPAVGKAGVLLGLAA